jgi:hypothetical protein
MAVTKVGQWTNVEDEVLKAAISKYGMRIFSIEAISISSD